MTGRILIVDDDRAMCETIATHLRLEGFGTEWHTSAERAFQTVQTADFDAVLTDLRMPGMNGLELCDRIVANRPNLPVVVITAFGSMESAIDALRAGAYDYVTKPIEMELLAATLRRAVEHHSLKERVQLLSERVARSGGLDQLLGSSPPMQRLFREIERLAHSEEGVLITGESGTGKELVAKALHRKSARRDGPFVVVNCAALPDALVESELFGHIRGAFTGAAQRRKGLFLEASGGTLLLDEVGDLPLALQPKLLRTMEERTIRHVGGEKERPVDVRVLAATNRDLDTAVDEGRFRDDLFFRLNIIHLEVPPLRARGNDILELARFFLEQCAQQASKPVQKISPAAAARLLGYGWPGNVRELRNAMARGVALSRTSEIVVEDLPEKIRRYRSSQGFLQGENPRELITLEELQRRYILHVLEVTGGNRTLASRVLGVDRKTLYNRLQRYGALPDPER